MGLVHHDALDIAISDDNSVLPSTESIDALILAFLATHRMHRMPAEDAVESNRHCSLLVSAVPVLFLYHTLFVSTITSFCYLVLIPNLKKQNPILSMV